MHKEKADGDFTRLDQARGQGWLGGTTGCVEVTGVSMAPQGDTARES